MKIKVNICIQWQSTSCVE